MNERHADELWTRHLDGDLNARQQADLQQLLQADQVRRLAYVDDAQMDAVLRMLASIDATEDDFVARIARQLPAAEKKHVGQPSLADRPEDAAILNRTSAVPPPVPPPVVNSDRAPRLRRPGELRRAADSTGTTRTGRMPDIRRRQWTPLFFTAAALLLVALIGAIVVLATGDRDPVAQDNKKQRLESIRPGENRKILEAPSSEIVRRPAPSIDRKPPDSHSLDDVEDDPSPRIVEAIVPKTEDVETPGILERPQPDQQVQPSQTEQAGFFARVTKSHEAVWESPPEAELGDQPLLLNSGLVEIEMRGGVALTVLGPADFQLDSPKRIVLLRGRLNALVPSQAIGFTVATPTSDVVDLGTEFDVAVEASGETSVRVHDGQVELATRTAPESEVKKWKLGVGQFKRIQHDGTSHDFLLTTDLDQSGRGIVGINGIQFAVFGREQLDSARKRVFQELADFRRDFVNRRGSKYSGLVRLNGDPIRFDNATRFTTAWRRTNAHFDNMQTLLDNVGTFRGSININGVEFKFNNRDDMLTQNKLFERMGIGVSSSVTSNLRELMKLRDELLRGSGRHVAEPVDEKGDIRGLNKVDGKDVDDFGSLGELLRLGEGLRENRDPSGDDRRRRLDELRRRDADTLDRERIGEDREESGR